MFTSTLVCAVAMGTVVGLGRGRKLWGNDRSARPPQSPLGDANSSRILFTGAVQGAQGEESIDVWGFTDTRFDVDAQGVVTLTGKRYALSGNRLPYLLPWVERTMGISIPLTNLNRPAYPPAIPQSNVPDTVAQALKDLLPADAICIQDTVRLRHGHGHTQEEMYAIKYGTIPRVPDVVVYPGSEEHVTALMALAQIHDVCLLPYGGGTSVTEALRCSEAETRCIISVDMARMNRVLWVDPINRMACIEAGAVGRHIQAALATQGFTMGHEPDSVEFSTLGGWIATHASGMKKNRYGNIEDIVLDMNVVTPQGLISRKQIVPRESAGSDVRRYIFGSEGTLGIVTQAVVKLFDKPEVQRYGSVIFPSFEDGVAFLYDLTQQGVLPASVRLVDNMQFQLSQALKPEKLGLAALKSQAEKLFVTRVKGLDPERMVACTLVFEGTAENVALQEKQLYGLAAQHRGMKGGAENGERGYQLTYGIAYIRDFVMNHYLLAESFETSVPWSRVLELCERVKRRVIREHAARKLPGKPLIMCRLTQMYATGVAVYFYFAYSYQGVRDPSAVYSAIEDAARDEILAAGGSISHHHGVGAIRQKFLPRVMSEGAQSLREKTRVTFDPQGILAANVPFARERK
jgi:alkyldihydroxyacetonephosphate synthase